MSDVRTPLHFKGSVTCQRESAGPLGLTLSGISPEHPGEVVHLAFSGGAPPELPHVLNDVHVERLEPHRYQVSSGGRSWSVTGVPHLHRTVGRAFYAAVPPRPVPLRKRIFWRVALALASSAPGRAVLFRLR
jgi:hypothetical protein